MIWFAYAYVRDIHVHVHTYIPIRKGIHAIISRAASRATVGRHWRVGISFETRGRQFPRSRRLVAAVGLCILRTSVLCPCLCICECAQAHEAVSLLGRLWLLCLSFSLPPSFLSSVFFELSVSAGYSVFSAGNVCMHACMCVVFFVFMFRRALHTRTCVM